MHIRELKANYEEKGLNKRCPMCQLEEDLQSFHVLEYNKEDKKYNLNDLRGREWVEIVGTYRNSKKSRSINNIGKEQNIIKEFKIREDNGKMQKLAEDRKRQTLKKKKIQEKDVEELKDSRRDCQGREKTDQNSRIEVKKSQF